MIHHEKSSWYFVCTGNICRSAFAQAYLQEKLPESSLVASGGTGINQALEPTDEIKSLAEEQGISLEGHRPRPLVEEEVRQYDVVLTATLAHRAQVLAEAPGLLNRTFTIKEFAQLLGKIDIQEITGETPSAWWRALARKASQRRSLVNTPENNLDIQDPFRKDMSVYNESVQEIIGALDAIVDIERKRAAQA